MTATRVDGSMLNLKPERWVVVVVGVFLIFQAFVGYHWAAFNQEKFNALEEKTYGLGIQLKETEEQVSMMMKKGLELRSSVEEDTKRLKALETKSVEKKAETAPSAAPATPNATPAASAGGEATSELDRYNLERLENFWTIKYVPSSVRHWFTYSESESEKINALEASDPQVLGHIRKYKLIPPPPKAPPKPGETIKVEIKDMSKGNAHILQHIFKNKSNGFFIECGAYDGMFLSNTVYLERLLGWTGLLVETEPTNFAQMITKDRNAYLVPACLSLTDKPTLAKITVGAHVYTKIDEGIAGKTDLPVQCFPVESLLLAMNRTSVDLFSLDIEGHELKVLQTIPFDKIEIRAVLAEFSHIKEGRKAIEDFMISKGYMIYPTIPSERTLYKWAEEDILFIKKGSGVLETRPS